MTLPSAARKVLLVTHIAVSVGWMGGAAAYVALNVPVVAHDDEATVRAAYLMMPVVADYLLMPLAVATLLTGIALGLGTRWGLLQHYWVTFSLGLTVLAAVVLLLHLPAIGELSRAASDPGRDVTTLGSDVFHSAGGLALLVIPLVLNVVKPRGLTRRGWRVQRARRESTSAG